MARAEQIPRQWRILRRLEVHRYGLSANDLAEEEDCPVRTIYRDLGDLEEAGFPLIQEKRGKRSLWKLAFNRSGPSVPFVFSEVCALWLGRRFMSFWQGTEYYDSICSAFEKVRAMLPPGVLEHLEDFDSKLVVRSREQVTERFAGIIPEINNALEQNERLEILYFSPSSRSNTRRKIDPYRLWIQDNVSYLIAYCHLREDIRTFHLSRIKELAVTEETFEDNPDFDLDEYLAGTFRAMGGEVMTVEILFDEGVRHVAEESIWHTTQELIEQEDGGVILRFQAGGLQEIKSWLLGFGPRVKVLQPDSLRDAMIADLKATAERYAE